MRADTASYFADGAIEADAVYESVTVSGGAADRVAQVRKCKLRFRTEPPPARVGLMLVGFGGNNGSTVLAGILANRRKLEWRTKTGTVKANWLGSVMLNSTCKLGLDHKGNFVSVALTDFVPLIKPEDLVVAGWDISGLALGDAMRRAGVLDILLQDQLYDEMQTYQPLPGLYIPDFIAANQEDRADSILPCWDRKEALGRIRNDICKFKADNNLDKVIILWTANTERFCDITPGVHDTVQSLLNAVEMNHPEISPSTVYGIAAALEGCIYINGSPQNSLVPGLVALARERNTFVAGDDFKSGQTKLKSVLTDFLVCSGLKVTSIVSYNHLGNNDGRNLSAEAQFRSKEISKSSVVNDIVEGNHLLYEPNEHPDHCIVIKYVPAVGDSKRAMDEYTSDIFMGGKSTIAIHNTCEDSLLAAPIIIDLVILADLCSRITVSTGDGGEYLSMDAVLSMLSFLCKAPLCPEGVPVVNAFNAQRNAIINLLRCCVGLPPENHLWLEHRFRQCDFFNTPSSRC